MLKEDADCVEQDEAGDGGTKRIEWAISLLSGTLVLLMFGYLVYQVIGSSDAPPDLQVSISGEGRGDAPAQLNFKVENRGDQAASTVTISLTSRNPDGAPPRSAVTLDFVPAHSEVTGAFLLNAGQAHDDMRLAVESYLDP